MKYELPKIRLQIVREGNYPSDVGQIKNPRDVVKLASGIYEGTDREKAYVLCLDIKGNVLSVECAAVGSVDACILEVREVYKAALLSNSSRIILVHNHPSGDVTPSSEDGAITEKIYKAGQILGIEFDDHVIYGSKEKYYSFKESGFFDNIYKSQDSVNVVMEECCGRKDRAEGCIDG